MNSINNTRKMNILISILVLSMIIPIKVRAYEKEVNEISERLSQKIVEEGKSRVAVVDFTDLGGRITELGRFLAEEFSVSIAGSSENYEVVDRTHLKSIIKEHKLSATGLIDPSTARKLGKIAGVEALVTGTLTPFGESVRLTIKVLDTETAKIITAERGNIAKTQVISYLLSQGIESNISNSDKSTSYIEPTTPITNYIKSKKIGNITVSVKKIQVLNNGIIANLDFYNHLGKEIKISIDGRSEPTLSDEKGNMLSFSHGLVKNYTRQSEWTNLNPNSTNDVVIHFVIDRRYSRTTYDEIGSIFSMSLTYWVNEDKNKSSKKYQVSFFDIQK